MAGSLLEDEFPLILVSGIAIAVDVVFSNEKHRDRLCFQLLFWLVAALDQQMTQAAAEAEAAADQDASNANAATSSQFALLATIWIHLILTCNILHILLRHIKQTMNAAMEQAHPMLSWTLNNHLRLSWIRFLAPSAWVALLGLCIEHAVFGNAGLFGHRGLMSIVVFLLIWLHLIYLERTLATPRAASGDTHGSARIVSTSWWMPVESPRYAAAFDAVAAQIDEGRWYDWSNKDVLQWIATKATQKPVDTAPTNPRDTKDESDESEQLAMNIVLEKLSYHSITGSTLHHLRSWQMSMQYLGIPHGPAVSLSKKVRELMLKHPSPHGDVEGQATSTGIEVTQSFHDSMDPANEQGMPQATTPSNGAGNDANYSSYMMQQDPRYHTRTGDGQPLPLTESEMSKEQQQRVQSIMKNKFGIELPPIRSSSSMSDHPLSDADTTPKTYTLSDPELPRLRPQDLQQVITQKPPNADSELAKEASYAEHPLTTTPLPHIPGVPPDMLQQMPSNIQAIAARNPELVRKLMTQRSEILNVTPQRPQPMIQDISPPSSADTNRTSLLKRRPAGQSVRRAAADVSTYGAVNPNRNAPDNESGPFGAHHMV